ncbi:MAG: TrmB family transcriptional regulator [Candidatus Asgardarchaeia archaeon]
MDISRVKNDLKKFGLTPYETKAYVALISHGKLTAKEVCQVANLPYSKIHEILNKLEKKGWIDSEIGRPTFYYPRPPKEVIEAVKERIILEFEEAAKRLIDELQPLFEEREAKERPEVWIIYGIDNIIRRILDTLNAAKKEILIAVPSLDLESLGLNNIIALVTSILVKGVKVKVLITYELKEKIEGIASLSNLEIRYRDQMFGGGIIKDNEEIILILSEKPNETLLAIWSKHTLVTTIGKAYFENLWESAQPIKQ